MQDLQAAVKIVRLMPFPVSLWSAQNRAYALQTGLYQRSRRKAAKGDERSKLWVSDYVALCDLLLLRLA